MYRITVPATTANIGPGFDAMGLALNLYLCIEIEADPSGNQSVYWEDRKVSPLPEDKNLILSALKRTLKKIDRENTGFLLRVMDCQIPPSRGLGSSASAIVAGIYAANAICGQPLSQRDIIELASELEGHPDNVVPAILGGMSISFLAEGRVFTSPISVPPQLGFAVMIPDFELSTEHARKALPDSYSKKDCIHNLSRAAYLVASFSSGSVNGLREALNDRIHQPYRIKLIHEGDTVFSHARSAGALGEYISGAGPTLIALYDKSDKAFTSKMKDSLKSMKNFWTLLDLEVCQEGATIEVIK